MSITPDQRRRALEAYQEGDLSGLTDGDLLAAARWLELERQADKPRVNWPKVAVWLAIVVGCLAFWTTWAWAVVRWVA